MSESISELRNRWHQSLIVRIIVLCFVLLSCLFAAVYYFATQYHRQTIAHMEERATNISEQVRVMFDAVIIEKGIDDAASEFPDLAKGILMDFELDPEGAQPDDSSLKPGDGLYFVAEQTVQLIDGTVVLVRMQLDIDPQTELLRAFQNRFLLSITVVFVLTLCALVYLIWRALRPLRDLSDSITEISKGNLRNVKATGSTSEIIALETTFNSMVDSLKEKEVVESKLRQAQRLSAIGNLAAGVAHDVRNPLNAIKLLSSHALDSLNEGNDQTAKQLTTIRNEVDRLEDIVSGFLSLAKEEELHFESGTIDSILEECLTLIKKDAEMREVTLVSELRAGDTSLQLDPRKISRAVLNVLLNALEACPEGGRVRLFSRILNDTCQVEVRDDGPGLTDDAAERIFEPYFTTKAMGTGLGLSITRGIIEEHRGTITLTSSEGSGCQVLISLPLN